MQPRPIIAVSMGDPAGIGPEVIVKALSSAPVRDICRPVLIGSTSIFSRAQVLSGSTLAMKSISTLQEVSEGDETVPVVECAGSSAEGIPFGIGSRSSGQVAAAALTMAVDLALSRKVEAMVTGPISKQAFHQAGYDVAGQTEFLAGMTASPAVAMMLVSPHLRVALVTTHCRLAEVAALISREKIIEKISMLQAWLPAYFGIQAPRMAVLSLNPHAGDGGLFGGEEKEIIEPAVQDAQRMGMRVYGPLSADSALARWPTDPYDVYLAMYHDQGLVAVKMDAAGKGVNITLGLPVIRTSPDHGTAFDIAGKGLADPGSMIEAIRLATSVALRRKAAGLHPKEV